MDLKEAVQTFDEAKAIPISLDQIRQIVPKDTRVVTYAELAGMDSLADLFGQSKHVILHIPIANMQSGHWVCVILHENSNLVEYHDSYGRAPDAAILQCSPSVRTHLARNGITLTELGRLLHNHRVVWSNVELQQDGSQHQECGYFVACRLGHSQQLPDAYLDWITSFPVAPDYVAFLYCLDIIERS